jgi:hypothetical protein
VTYPNPELDGLAASANCRRVYGSEGAERLKEIQPSGHPLPTPRTAKRPTLGLSDIEAASLDVLSP